MSRYYWMLSICLLAVPVAMVALPEPQEARSGWWMNES
jgi:hypothetical protein